MPKAGKKHFPYTKAGKKRAQKYAKKHGLKVKGSKNPGYVPEGAISMNRELYKRIGRLYETHPVSDKELKDDAAPFRERAEKEKREAAEKEKREAAEKKRKEEERLTDPTQPGNLGPGRDPRKNESVWTTYKGMANLLIGEAEKN